MKILFLVYAIYFSFAYAFRNVLKDAAVFQGINPRHNKKNNYTNNYMNSNMNSNINSNINSNSNYNKLYFRTKRDDNNLIKRKSINPLFDTFEDVKKIAAKELSIEESKITLDANFTQDLGADSLDLVQMIMALEEKFGVTIPDSDAMKIKTVKDAVDYIDKNKK